MGVLFARKWTFRVFWVLCTLLKAQPTSNNLPTSTTKHTHTWKYIIEANKNFHYLRFVTNGPLTPYVLRCISILPIMEMKCFLYTANQQQSNPFPSLCVLAWHMSLQCIWSIKIASYDILLFLNNYMAKLVPLNRWSHLKRNLMKMQWKHFCFVEYNTLWFIQPRISGR